MKATILILAVFFVPSLAYAQWDNSNITPGMQDLMQQQAIADAETNAEVISMTDAHYARIQAQQDNDDLRAQIARQQREIDQLRRDRPY